MSSHANDWISSETNTAPAGPAYRRLSLPEAILLLSHDERSGEMVRGLPTEALNRAYLGGGIVDLAVRGRLRVLSSDEPVITPRQIRAMVNSLMAWVATDSLDVPIPCYLEHIGTEPTDSAYLDLIESRIAASKGLRSVQTLGGWAMLCLGRNSTGEWKTSLVDQTHAVATDLVARNAVTLQEPSGIAAHLLRSSQPRVVRTGVVDTGEDSLHLRLSEIVAPETSSMRERDCDLWTGALLCLISTLGLTDSVFGAAHREKAEWRIRQYVARDSHPSSILAALSRYVQTGPARGDLITLPPPAPGDKDDY